MVESVSDVREAGPWTHEDVSAGGISFHVAVSGDGPHTVLLLHDFPLYWWSWRAQLPFLADAGYRAVAADLRGFGGTDFQPGDVSLQRLRVDLTSLLRSLGAQSATVVGAGMGGAAGWLLGHDAPPSLRSLVLVNAPHPLVKPLKRRQKRGPSTGGVRVPKSRGRLVRSLQSGRLERALLQNWSAPANREAMGLLAPRYSQPMSRRFAARAAAATYTATQNVRPTERRLFRDPVQVPTLSIKGDLDPAHRQGAYSRDLNYVASRYVREVVPDVGHYVSEEAPQELNRLLLEHLEGLDL